MRFNESGAASVLAVCSVVFGLGLAASVYLNYFQAQRSADEKYQLKGQITDLTYQVEQDRKNGTVPKTSASPSPEASPSASATPGATPAKTITFTELGVSVSATDPVSDLIYSSQPKNGVVIVGLTSSLLVAKYPKCIASYLGQISKRAVGVKPNANEILIKTIAGNAFYYMKPIVECATDDAGKSLRASLVNAVQTSILPTLN